MKKIAAAVALASIGFACQAAGAPAAELSIPKTVCAGVSATFLSNGTRYGNQEWNCGPKGQATVVGTTKASKLGAPQHSLLMMHPKNTLDEELKLTSKLVGGICSAAGGRVVPGTAGQTGFAVECVTGTKSIWTAEAIGAGNSVALQITEHASQDLAGRNGNGQG